jgi:hypothetical protein
MSVATVREEARHLHMKLVAQHVRMQLIGVTQYVQTTVTMRVPGKAAARLALCIMCNTVVLWGVSMVIGIAGAPTDIVTRTRTGKLAAPVVDLCNYQRPNLYSSAWTKLSGASDP